MLPSASNTIVSIPSDGLQPLEREARFLHHSMFGRTPNEALVAAYISAHQALPDLQTADPRQMRTVQSIIACRLDAVGIEPWLRRPHRRHALTAKLLLIAYLAECDAAHSEFYRVRPATPRAIQLLTYLSLVGVMRMLRGYWQRLRYGLL